MGYTINKQTLTHVNSVYWIDSQNEKSVFMPNFTIVYFDQHAFHSKYGVNMNNAHMKTNSLFILTVVHWSTLFFVFLFRWFTFRRVYRLFDGCASCKWRLQWVFQCLVYIETKMSTTSTAIILYVWWDLETRYISHGYLIWICLFVHFDFSQTISEIWQRKNF